MQKTIQNVFTSRKLKQDLSLCEPKPNIVTQSYYVLITLEKKKHCNSAVYCLFVQVWSVHAHVSYTKGYLHTRVEGHCQKVSFFYKHYSKEHNTAVLNNLFTKLQCNKKMHKQIWLQR